MELQLQNVTKKYGKNIALEEFCYIFNAGIYGLLGPNGAGKSTLINLITGNLQVDKGDILFNGTSIKSMGTQYLQHIGYVPQQQNLYPTFTGERFMYYMAAIKGLDQKKADKEIKNIMEKVHLTEEKNHKIKEYSGGMKQRLLIGQALLGKPTILIMDEPTAGLDPNERVAVRNILAEYADEKIVLFATHVISDIEMTADKVLMLNKGKLVETEALKQWEKEKNSLEKIYINVFKEAKL